MTDNCQHVWIPNSGQGGEPDFRMNRHMSGEPLMHVKCDRCNARTWFTKEQWYAMPTHPSDAPDAGGEDE